MLITVSLIIGALTTAMASKAMERPVLRIVLAPLLGLALGWMTWTLSPTLSPDFYDLPFLFMLSGLVCLGAFLAGHVGADDSRIPARVAAPAFALAVGLAWILALFVSSFGYFREAGYRNVIQVEERRMDTGIELLDQTHARLVDASLAERRAVQLLGVEKGLGSSFVIGAPTVQIVRGREVWVAPLEPAGFWSWLQHRGSPGYVVVSATDFQDARIVLDHRLRVTLKSWFLDNVKTAVYEADPKVGRMDYSFEVDEDGKPFWVSTTYENTVSAHAPRATGVEILDAGTGERKWYAIGTEPDWVDRVIPEDMAEEQLRYWGDYVKGWANFSNDEVVHPTGSGLSLVYTAAGRPAWFSGIVNSRSESSTSAATNGFVLVDSKTGKATVYYKPGISESAARGTIQGLVQNSRYRASFPIAYSVHGALTYVATLKDDFGNPRLIGMASAFDSSVAATGNTLEEATQAYLAKLRTSGARPGGLRAEARPDVVSGTLVRSGLYTTNGLGYMLARLEVGGATRDFNIDLSVPALREIVLARPGDAVRMDVLSVPEGTDEVRSVKVTPKADVQGEATR